MYIIHHNLVHNLRSYLKYLKWLSFFKHIQASNKKISVSFVRIISDLLFQHHAKGYYSFRFGTGDQRKHFQIMNTLSRLGLIKLDKGRTIDYNDLAHPCIGIRYKAKITSTGKKYLEAVNIHKDAFKDVKPLKPVTFSDLSLFKKLVVGLGTLCAILDFCCAITTMFLIIIMSASSVSQDEHLVALLVTVGSLLLIIPSIACILSPYAIAINQQREKYIRKVKNINSGNHDVTESRFLGFLIENNIIDTRLDNLNYQMIRVINNIMFS